MDWTKTSDQVDRAVYSVPLWSMADKDVQAEQFRALEDVLRMEDHLLDGVFGSRLLKAGVLDGTPDTVHPVALFLEERQSLVNGTVKRSSLKPCRI
jgi:hypothetical protein